jgi:hypothetical protein
MSDNSFPPLALADWQPTRDTIATYAQVLGKIRRALTPRQKHWWHISLRGAATGLTTTPIPAGELTFELLLDFAAHKLVITTSRGEQWHQPLRGQSPATFCEETLAALASLGVEPEIDRSLFSDATPGRYDPAAVRHYWQAASQIDAIFKQFKGELRQETSPVQLWPHHFDLAVVWFSGRLVPGVDPAEEENADEQMNFGFSTGDEGLPEPYFYITAYPLPDGLLDTPLPADASWHTSGFTGAVLKYESLVGADAPAEKLLDFLRTVQQAGARLMQ